MIINLQKLKDDKRIFLDYIVALEGFLPSWLKSLVPHYQEAKRKNVELLALSNFLCLGTPATLYENNGIGYYLLKNEALGGMELAFNSDYKYQKVGWNECFERDYPELFRDEGLRSNYFIGINSYMSRLSNREEPYNLIAKQVDEYFKEITGDSNVGFSLGYDSFIYFTKKAENYINRHHYLD